MKVHNLDQNIIFPMNEYISFSFTLDALILYKIKKKKKKKKGKQKKNFIKKLIFTIYLKI